MDMDPLVVDATLAVPLGLITSELIMNALKYAFPGGKAGTIHIRLKMSGAQAELMVGDDGIGIDPSKARDGSFGVLLVRSLARQIFGEASLDSKSGSTTWVIRFPVG
jgi:two-component sensor histidine kinase